MTPGNVDIETLSKIMSGIGALNWSLAKQVDSTTNVYDERPRRTSTPDVYDGCPRRMSTTDVHDECPRRMSTTNVHDECLRRMSDLYPYNHTYR